MFFCSRGKPLPFVNRHSTQSSAILSKWINPAVQYDANHLIFSKTGFTDKTSAPILFCRGLRMRNGF